MKHRKVFTAVIAVVLLCSLASIAYADGNWHPWIKGLILWKLRNDIDDNTMRINELYEIVADLQDQIDNLNGTSGYGYVIVSVPDIR